MPLQITGVGSNLDANSIISQLMQLEQRPLIVLNQREASYQAKLSAFGTIKGALSALQSAARAISAAAAFSVRKATVADSTIFTATASTTAASGSYDVEVRNLAQAQKLRTIGVSATSALGSGALTLAFGTYRTVDADNVVFDANASKPSRTITVAAGTDKLSDIRDAINNAGAGVTASIVGDGASAHLFVASNDTGLANQLRITVDDNDGNDTDASGLSILAYDAVKTAGVSGAKNLTEFASAEDSRVVINGIAITSASNAITKAIDGATLTLLKESDAGVTTKLTVANDNAAVKSAIDAFVKAYNDANKTLRDATKFDAAAKKGSTLTGDSTVLAVQSRLRDVLSAAVEGAAGFTRLSDIGIAFQLDGSLATDSAKLQTALSDPNKSVASLFIANGASQGIAARIDAVTSGMLSSTGLLAGRTDGIDSSIKDIGKRREAIERRLEAVEKRYRAQFTALDTLISSMTNTASFLQQQLSSLPTFTQGQ